MEKIIYKGLIDKFKKDIEKNIEKSIVTTPMVFMDTEDHIKEPLILIYVNNNSINSFFSYLKSKYDYIDDKTIKIDYYGKNYCIGFRVFDNKEKMNLFKYMNSYSGIIGKVFEKISKSYGLILNEDGLFIKRDDLTTLLSNNFFNILKLFLYSKKRFVKGFNKNELYYYLINEESINIDIKIFIDQIFSDYNIDKKDNINYKDKVNEFIIEKIGLTIGSKDSINMLKDVIRLNYKDLYNNLLFMHTFSVINPNESINFNSIKISLLKYVNSVLDLFNIINMNKKEEILNYKIKIVNNKIFKIDDKNILFILYNNEYKYSIFVKFDIDMSFKNISIKFGSIENMNDDNILYKFIYKLIDEYLLKIDIRLNEFDIREEMIRNYNKVKVN